ncbi:ABC transporter permease [Vibrio sp. SS-MA-C1-2]|uniref:ABC transporter permease n=1 Tax=Vibrio sp. SS-MA-C1-2 TaxID=2908646 RepID=UPI001F3F0202|nr:ABC transporter permease [Vibrio sp. SS-MA-C1-2]UJF17801.1 ABC transporter permease [Vibrio sp. SS-MA-C1-2]
MNTRVSELQKNKPNLKMWLLDDSPTSQWQAQCSSVYRIWLSLASNPLTVIGLLFILLLLIMAIFAPLIATHSPIETHLAARLLPPSWDNWLGTDHLGRDIFSRLIYGSQVTVLIVFLVTITTAPFGMLVGVVAGYFGGWVEVLLMRITDIFLAFPKLVMALAFVAIMEPGLWSMVMAISLTAWSPYARVARAEALTCRRSDYIQAAILSGASTPRILLKHIVPMCSTSVIIRVTLDMAGIILVASGLGFLGLGIAPPTPEWGAMIAEGRSFLIDQWWVATIPGIAILLVSLAFNLLGDGLRDALEGK